LGIRIKRCTRILTVCCAAVFAYAGVALGVSLTGSTVTEFTGGRWFDGEAFQEKTFYAVDGILRTAKPGAVGRTIDLAGGFVVPAYGEAHTHNISRPPRAKELARFVKDGVFYAMVQNNMFTNGDAVDTGPIDVVYANGGITPSGGHVVHLHEKLMDWGVIKGMTKPELDGLAFFVVDNIKDLDEKWPEILASNPDFVKIFLGFSEQHEARLGEGYAQGLRGLDPALVPEIVRRAHGAGLRVSAHIETAEDFRVALSCGVDIIAHLPGWRVGEDAGFKPFDRNRWLLTDKDAARAAESGTVVLTTVLAGSTTTKPEHHHFKDVRALHLENLHTLARHGVRLAVGSDLYGGTSVAEALALGSDAVEGSLPPLGAFANKKIVSMLCESTPQVIFPGRKVGRLEEGYEANFLVLDGDPLVDLRHLTGIGRRFKQGEEIPAAP